jgi:uncharacterized protein YkwD
MGDGCCTPARAGAAPDPDCAKGTCGDGTCAAEAGETCENCPADCNSTGIVCGNGDCQAGETPTNCEADCGPPVWPADWAALEQKALDDLNALRAKGFDCPGVHMPPVPPVTMDPVLQRTAELHAWDLEWEGYFAHQSCNGRLPWDRARERGTSATGEGITSGTSILGFTFDAPHCTGIMDAHTVKVGIGVAGGVLVYDGRNSP